MTSKNDIKGLVSLKFLRPWAEASGTSKEPAASQVVRKKSQNFLTFRDIFGHVE
jgi:hypothetical protein